MTLEVLNSLDEAALREALSSCCGSQAWVSGMMALFPMRDVASLLEAARKVWHACREEDWREAFTYHPKIGDLDPLKRRFAGTGVWAAAEQSGTSGASMEV